jgi:hypothetical protein
MSAGARVAVFALLLLGVFGAAALAGSAIGPEPTQSRGHAPGGEHDERAGDGGHGVRGLAVAEGGLRLSLESPSLAATGRTQLRFVVLGPGGEHVRRFEVEHEKRMHVIVVRRDGSGFQHLHPELGADGVWRTGLTLSEPGSYRVFADFKREGETHTLAADLTVDGEAEHEPWPEPSTTARAAGGYEVHLDASRLRAGEEAELRFTVARDGRAVHTEPYLGAGGHLVALREGDLAYLHVHPAGHARAGASEEHDDAVGFTAAFPSEGSYRLYLQFKHEGRVHTAAFTQEVSR